MSAVTARAGLLRRLARHFNPTRPEIAADLLLAAADLDRLDRVDAIDRVRAGFAGGVCARCGADLGQRPGRGRPRRYCTDCSPRKNSGKIRAGGM